MTTDDAREMIGEAIIDAINRYAINIRADIDVDIKQGGAGHIITAVTQGAKHSFHVPRLDAEHLNPLGLPIALWADQQTRTQETITA